MPDLAARLSHELAVRLRCVLVLADRLGVDIEQAFAATMKQLKDHAWAEPAG